MCLSRSRRAVKLLNSDDEIVDAGAVGAIDPLSPITDAIVFVVESDGAAYGDVGLR